MNPACRIYRIKIDSARVSNKEISHIGYAFLALAASDFRKDLDDPDRIGEGTVFYYDGNRLLRGRDDRSDIDGADQLEREMPDGCDSAAGDITEEPASGEYDVLRTQYGKPYFANHPEIEFNISNSGDWIFIAVSTVCVGIDVQVIKDMALEKVARRVFNPEEYAFFLSTDNRVEYFFREWVLRESYIKWTGEGLTRDMRKLPHDAWQTLLTAPEGYKAAITASKPLECSDTAVCIMTV